MRGREPGSRFYEELSPIHGVRRDPCMLLACRRGPLDTSSRWRLQEEAGVGRVFPGVRVSGTLTPATPRRAP